MSKERLEEAKLMAKMLRVETRLPHDFPFDLVDWLVEQAELVYKMQTDFLNANKHKNIYKEQNKLYREAIENIKKYNQKALKVDDYTKSEALLDISLEIMKLEGEE